MSSKHPYFLSYILCFFTICGQLFGQTDSTKIFTFGHSLIDHRPPLIPTPSDETTVAHWMYEISVEAGNGLGFGGKYGFLPQHAILPPFSQWGYDNVPAVWYSDSQTFAEADLTTILLTAGNFIQYQPADMDYDGQPGISPLSATEDIFDWVDAQGDNPSYYIYENWPEMGGYLNNGFPPTAAEFEDYNDFTQNDFHQWWLDYHDLILASRPDYQVKMIPVGPILGKIYSDLIPGQIPFTELYEDADPHGRANTYFLAGMISYMAIFQEKIPSSYTPPSIIDPIIITNLQDIVDFAWEELLNFVDDNGNSRVFLGEVSDLVDVSLDANNICLYPNPTNGYFQIFGDLQEYDIDVLDGTGAIFESYTTQENFICIHLENLPNGLYYIRLTHTTSGDVSLEKILKQD